MVALGDYTRVYDKIVAGGGTDVLNIRSSGSGVGPLAVLMDTYRVPVSQLANGVPVLQATDAALPTYHLSPVQKLYFGGEAVLDPFTGQAMLYAGGEDVRDIFTGELGQGRARQHAQARGRRRDAAHRGRPRLPRARRAADWLGGEAVVDELGNPVYNNATTPFRYGSGQVAIEDRRQRVYTSAAPVYFNYSGSAAHARLRARRAGPRDRDGLPGHADREPDRRPVLAVAARR